MRVLMAVGAVAATVMTFLVDGREALTIIRSVADAGISSETWWLLASLLVKLSLTGIIAWFGWDVLKQRRIAIDQTNKAQDMFTKATQEWGYLTEKQERLAHMQGHIEFLLEDAKFYTEDARRRAARRMMKRRRWPDVSY